MFKKDSHKNTKVIFSLKEVASLLRNPDASKIEIAPYRDWRIVGICFFIMLIVSFGFNMYILFEVNRDSFFAVSEIKSQGISFNREGLNRVLDAIQRRENTFERLKTGMIGVSDPSL